MLTSSKKHHAFFIAIIIFSLSACETVPEPEPTKEEIAPIVKKTGVSAEPISQPPVELIKKTQAKLTLLGYKIGAVDGIWGKRSIAAMKSFELNNNLVSADGQLSELNLNLLDKLAPITQQTSRQAKVEKPATLSSQIDTPKLNSNSPQLIIIEQSYSLLSKANPYSSLVKQLKPGAGFYVLSQPSNNWFEVETLKNERGFIKAK